MKNRNDTKKCEHPIQSCKDRKKLSDALKLLDGISRLPLSNDPDRAEEIQKIFGAAQKKEKF